MLNRRCACLPESEGPLCRPTDQLGRRTVASRRSSSVRSNGTLARRKIYRNREKPNEERLTPLQKLEVSNSCVHQFVFDWSSHDHVISNSHRLGVRVQILYQQFTSNGVYIKMIQSYRIYQFNNYFVKQSMFCMVT